MKHGLEAADLQDHREACSQGRGRRIPAPQGPTADLLPVHAPHGPKARMFPLSGWRQWHPGDESLVSSFSPCIVCGATPMQVHPDPHMNRTGARWRFEAFHARTARCSGTLGPCKYCEVIRQLHPLLRCKSWDEILASPALHVYYTRRFIHLIELLTDQELLDSRNPSHRTSDRGTLPSELVRNTLRGLIDNDSMDCPELDTNVLFTNLQAY